MGFSHLGNKNWRDITRDERYFCAELFFHIKGKEKEFVNWLMKQPSINCISVEDIEAEWEIGYEVCFYRDYIRVIGEKNKNRNIKKSLEKYPVKRTFDLCLFSEKKIIIIEAKAQQGFHSEQNSEFEKDRNLLRTLLDEKVSINFIALCSSVHFKNLEKHGKEKGLPKVFEGNWISWNQLKDFNNGNPVFDRAEGLYNDKKIK